MPSSIAEDPALRILLQAKFHPYSTEAEASLFLSLILIRAIGSLPKASQFVLRTFHRSGTPFLLWSPRGEGGVTSGTKKRWLSSCSPQHRAGAVAVEDPGHSWVELCRLQCVGIKLAKGSAPAACKKFPSFFVACRVRARSCVNHDFSIPSLWLGAMSLDKLTDSMKRLYGQFLSGCSDYTFGLQRSTASKSHSMAGLKTYAQHVRIIRASTRDDHAGSLENLQYSMGMRQTDSSAISTGDIPMFGGFPGYPVQSQA